MGDRRVRTGCATCRKRRVKCDEAKPICMRCKNGNFQCEGYALPRRAAAGSTTSTSSSMSPEPTRSSSPESVLGVGGGSGGFAGRTSTGIPELGCGRQDWRHEQLPLYHHFVTVTVVRLFRKDHVTFWRDQVAQMSYGVDIVYEALLAIGAVHRSSLVACQEGNSQEAARFKVLGLRSYGKILQLLPTQLSRKSPSATFATLVVLMLLAYFECFMENPKGALRHLWAAIQLLRGSEAYLSDKEVSNMVPIFDAMLRLDFLAQKLVPFAGSSFLRFGDLAIMESPFWNRLSPKYSDSTQSDLIAAERYRLIQLVCAHNKLSRVVWGSLCPPDERPSRDELMGFYSEMVLWKATSPATFEECEGLESLNASDPAAVAFLPIPPPPYYFSSNEAALNVAMYNGYVGCAVALMSTMDLDPAARELETFNLAYQNMSIAAGLIKKHRDSDDSDGLYKPCDAISMGITGFLYHAVRRCFSPAWQRWTISALREIGREGLSNGATLANTVEIMCKLEAKTRQKTMDDFSAFEANAYIGPVRDRLIPLLMPRGDEDDHHLAFYLKHQDQDFEELDGTISVVAKATWKEDSSGKIKSLTLEEFEEESDRSSKPQAPDLFHPWRRTVERGWHGYLSDSIQERFLQNNLSPASVAA